MDNLLNLNKGDTTGIIDKLGYQLFESSGLKFKKKENVTILSAGTYSDAVGHATNVLTRREQEIPHLYRWWDELR